MAAGKGTRMRSNLPKALHPLAAKPLLGHVLGTARALAPERIVVIVGHEREAVVEAMEAEDVEFAVQDPQLGTGHALSMAEACLNGFVGDILVLSGDVPLIRRETLEDLIRKHKSTDAALTMLTCVIDDPGSYGRIVRENGNIAATVEAGDATAEQLMIKEFNTGIYVFNSAFVFPALKKITADNAQGEYYLTDLVAIAVGGPGGVASVTTSDYHQVQGVNTIEQLAELEKHYHSMAG